MAGLEKLKSVFANIKNFNNTNLTKDMGTTLGNTSRFKSSKIDQIYLKNSSTMSEIISFNKSNIKTAEKYSPILSNNIIDNPSLSAVGGRHSFETPLSSHNHGDDKHLLHRSGNLDDLILSKLTDVSSFDSAYNDISTENEWFTFSGNVQKNDEGFV